MSNEGPFKNTDREIWRETPGDYYAPSIHVTEGGGIGIDVSGWVMVLPVRTWHKLGDIFCAVNPSVSNWRWTLAMWLLKRPYKW